MSKLTREEILSKLKENEYELIREALQYGVMWSRNESETAEFALLLMKVEKILFKLRNEDNNPQRSKSN